MGILHRRVRRSLSFIKFALQSLNVSDAIVAASAVDLGRHDSNVALVLLNCFFVATLLEVGVAEMNNGKFKIRLEGQGPLIFRNRLRITSRPLIASAQAVMRVWLFGRQGDVMLVHSNRFIVPAEIQIRSAQTVVEFLAFGINSQSLLQNL